MKKRYQELQTMYASLSAEVQTTAKQGDLRENWGYTAAMDEWKKVSQEMKYLHNIVNSHHDIVGQDDIKNTSVVDFGALVSLVDSKDMNKRIQFQIVSEEELSYVKSGVTEKNRCVQNILGLSEGDSVNINSNTFILEKIIYED